MHISTEYIACKVSRWNVDGMSMSYRIIVQARYAAVSNMSSDFTFCTTQ
jgi:hypothetical protein